MLPIICGLEATISTQPPPQNFTQPQLLSVFKQVLEMLGTQVYSPAMWGRATKFSWLRMTRFQSLQKTKLLRSSQLPLQNNVMQTHFVLQKQD